MKEDKDILFLVINPGSTSTEIAVFQNNREIFSRNIERPQKDMVLVELRKHGYELQDLCCIVARGGVLKPVAGGTYRINTAMLYDLNNAVYGAHASNQGAVLAQELADLIKVEAFIVDPVTVDELTDIAKVSGLPELERISIFHALNHKAAARKAASDLGKEYTQVNLIVAHMGGGISVAAHAAGRVVDVNNALQGEGPLAPTRTGSLTAASLVELAFSGRYSKDELLQKISRQGGLYAHLGTADLREIKAQIEQGDKKAELIYTAMAYQIAREIGACAAVLKGRVDALIFTGGMAHDEDLLKLLSERVSFIADILVYPGSFEMEALAAGALRVLQGEEEAREY